MLRRRPFALISCLTAFAIAACGKDSGTEPREPETPVVTTIEVTAPSQTLSIGQAVQFSATVKDQLGAVMTGQSVVWSSASAAASVSTDGLVTALAAGQASITATVAGKQDSAQVSVLAPPQPPPVPACTDCLELVPSGIILPSAGAAQQLSVYRVDPAGQRTAVSATFESSDPSKVSVSSNGVATAVTGIGSAQIIAHVGLESTTPVVALVATPAAGALLVTDAQIDGEIIPLDATAPITIGWRSHVRLKGATPVAGQMVINTGSQPVGGKVISVTPVDSVVDVVLELVPLSTLFSAINFQERISLAGAQERIALPRTARRDLEDFDVGVFSCKAKGQVSSIPVRVENLSYSVNPNLNYEIGTTGGTHLVVSGTLAPEVKLRPVIIGTVTGAFSCRAKVKDIIVPIGGALSQFFGAIIPYGVGFKIDAKGQTDAARFDIELQGDVDVTFGPDCRGECRLVNEIESDATGSFVPTLPPLLNGTAEVKVEAFTWAELHVGSPLSGNAQFNTMEVEAGLQQSVFVASSTQQAFDSTLAAHFDLDAVLEARSGDDIAAAAGLIGITLPPLEATREIPIARSPRGSFTATPGDPASGDATQLGEQVTFTIDLNSADYLGAPAVDDVEIRWVQEDENGDSVLAPGRPGCTTLHGTAGQKQFSCNTDFLREHEGKQKFYAFVHAKMFGVDFPVPLEVASNSLVTLDVTRYGHVHRRVDFTNGNLAETDATTTEPLVASGSGFTGSGFATYHAIVIRESQPNCFIHADFNGVGHTFDVVSTGTDQWALRAVINGTQEDQNPCGGVSNTFPFQLTVTLANGVSIRRDGVITGIDFTQNVANANATIVATGKLRIE